VPLKEKTVPAISTAFSQTLDGTERLILIYSKIIHLSNIVLSLKVIFFSYRQMKLMLQSDNEKSLNPKDRLNAHRR